MVAVLSDIHGNLEAFNKVLEYLLKRNIEEIYILGDIVDYGADSVSIINLIFDLINKDISITCIRGNHEDAIINPQDSKFNTEHAKKSIEITRREIYSDEKTLSRFMKLSLSTYCDIYTGNKSLRFIHGTNDDFLRGHHGTLTINKYDNLLSLKEFSNITFGGHSHIQGYKCTGNSIFINPGSVGQPRNGDPRSQFIICDDNFKEANFVRLNYDVKLASDKVVSSGRPRFLSTRILLGI